MSRSAEPTRARLIAAAEQLFAAHGIDGVSLREINRASGARNAIAVQYHFEDRAGVVRAILQKHQPDVDARRHAMLDEYVAAPIPSLRTLAAALVQPSAAKLADRDGGPAYLQILSYLINRPDAGTETAPADDAADSIQRWRALLEPLLEQDALRLHRRFIAIRFTAVELGRRAASGPHADDRLFVSHLIDLVTALLGAPVSEETIRFADDRDAHRDRRRRSPVP